MAWCSCACFKPDSKVLYRRTNVALALLHTCALIATVGVVLRAIPLTPYYSILVSETRRLNVQLAFVPIALHALSAVFHAHQAYFSDAVVDLTLATYNRNGARWFRAFAMSSLNNITVILLHGIRHVSTIAVLVGLGWGITAMLMMHTEFINPHYDFDPIVNPLRVMIALYAPLFIFMFASNFRDESRDEISTQIGFVTTIVLVQPLVVAGNLVVRTCMSDKAALGDAAKSDFTEFEMTADAVTRNDDDEDSRESNTEVDRRAVTGRVSISSDDDEGLVTKAINYVNDIEARQHGRVMGASVAGTQAKIDRLDRQLAEIRREVISEVADYFMAFAFETLVSLMVVYITFKHRDLYGEVSLEQDIDPYSGGR